MKKGECSLFVMSTKNKRKKCHFCIAKTNECDIIVLQKQNNKGEKMKIEFIEKDQIWKNETTNYWFNVDGENYAISDQNGELSLLDEDGTPIPDCNNKGIKDLLILEYQKHIHD
jgi:hypothetical protein